jgi:hypothetical protein
MAGPNLLRGCARTCCVVESLNHSHHEAKENSFMNTYLYHPLPHVLHVWYIYLQNWVILFGQMLANSPYMEHMGTRDSHVYHTRLLNCKSTSICCNKSNNSWRICVPKVKTRYSSSNKRQVHFRENVAWYPSQFLVSRTAATLEKKRHALSCDIELNHVIYGYRKKGHCVTIETIHNIYIYMCALG